MSTPIDSDTPPAPQWQILSSYQRRVLGVLIEKAKTTPAAYPMTLNAIRTGSNQKSNRSPQLDLREEQIEQALDDLRGMGAISEVHGDGRVAKYRHYAYEWLGVDKKEIAVMAELLLRGEQTLGELRGRAARMEAITDVAELRPLVKGLMDRGLVIALTSPGRGQIVTHALYKDRERNDFAQQYGTLPGSFPVDASADASADAGAGSDEASTPSPTPPPPTTATTAPSPAAHQPAAAQPAPSAPAVNDDRIEELEQEVDQLKEELRDLRRRVDFLEQ